VVQACQGEISPNSRGPLLHPRGLLVANAPERERQHVLDFDLNSNIAFKSLQLPLPGA
jgi:hypothetical protein